MLGSAAMNSGAFEQLGPDLRPVVWAQIASRHGPVCCTLNGGAVSGARSPLGDTNGTQGTPLADLSRGAIDCIGKRSIRHRVLARHVLVQCHAPIMIAKATELQAAFAIDDPERDVVTLGRMTKEEIAAFRVERLRAMLALPPYEGNKAKLGKALGFESGAYIRQMLEGVRPITEKLIDRIERMDNMKGWFSPPPLVGVALVLTAEERDIILTHRAIRAKSNPYVAASEEKSGQRKIKPQKRDKKAGGQ